jgi:hypothetical protein
MPRRLPEWQRRLGRIGALWFRAGESQVGIDHHVALKSEPGRKRKLSEEEVEALRKAYREACARDPALRQRKAAQAYLCDLVKAPPSFGRTLCRRVVDPVLKELGQN